MIELTQRIAIVGAGLCGSLLAVNLVQRGFNVTLFEKRPDLRKVEMDGGRSINLALSNRGLQALSKVGLSEEVRDLCIPMQGRMIHDLKGNTRFSPYSGREDEYINSISRTGLNALLLDKAESYSNLDLFFNAGVLDIDVQKSKIKYHYLDQDVTEEFDVIIGTDGAGSVVRNALKTFLGDDFQYSSDMLKSSYKELEIPAGPNNDFLIDGSSLHIWPRGHFMIIALPNLDKSFTVTMFNPNKGEQSFESLNTDEEILSYFNDFFPDLVDKLPALQDDFDDHPIGKLGTIKCEPWHSKGKVLIMGDASHAIVPFYGQGMNASFEDVYVFDELLEEHMNKSWEELFKAFQQSRRVNTDAIADLALDNFHEMQDKVDDEDFIQKRKLEMILESTFEDYYSKYSLVTFREDLSYSEAMEQGRKQDVFLLEMCSKSDFKIPDSKEGLREIVEQVKKHIE